MNEITGVRNHWSYILEQVANFIWVIIGVIFAMQGAWTEAIKLLREGHLKEAFFILLEDLRMPGSQSCLVVSLGIDHGMIPGDLPDQPQRRLCVRSPSRMFPTGQHISAQQDQIGRCFFKGIQNAINAKIPAVIVQVGQKGKLQLLILLPGNIIVLHTKLPPLPSAPYKSGGNRGKTQKCRDQDTAKAHIENVPACKCRPA